MADLANDFIGFGQIFALSGWLKFWNWREEAIYNGKWGESMKWDWKTSALHPQSEYFKNSPEFQIPH